jgi:cytidylate kinase
MIVTVDGPAGAGKSSVAKALADRLGFQFLDTGATYRTVALAAFRAGLGENDARQIGELAARTKVRLEGDRVFLDDDDVSDAIRTPQVTAVTRFAADNPDVRRHLVNLQRAMATGQDVVAEGRDQGTVVFPQAECKIFLTASVDERARRRLADFQDRGEQATLEEVRQAQIERDRRDESREFGPLKKAADAIEVLTDGMTLDQVVDQLEKIVRKRM